MWLDALWTKRRPEGTPPTFMMHRFLASNRDYALFARYLQLDLRREPDLIFGTWQALLPKERGAPRLSYVVAKKRPEAEALTTRMQQVLGESRVVAEEMQALVVLTGREQELYIFFGVEPPATPVEEAVEEVAEEPTGGLLDLV